MPKLSTPLLRLSGQSLRRTDRHAMHNTDITLPAFAAERRRLLSIDIYCRLDAQQQTRRMPLLLSINGTDRQTGGRTDGRQTVSQTVLRYYAGCSSERLAVRGTHVWYSEEVELEHADDGLSHGRPVGQVVSEPVTGMSTAARERRPTDNHTALTTTGRAAQRPTTTHSPSPLCPNRFFL